MHIGMLQMTYQMITRYGLLITTYIPHDLEDFFLSFFLLSFFLSFFIYLFIYLFIYRVSLNSMLNIKDCAKYKKKQQVITRGKNNKHTKCQLINPRDS